MLPISYTFDGNNFSIYGIFDKSSVTFSANGNEMTLTNLKSGETTKFNKQTSVKSNSIEGTWQIEGEVYIFKDDGTGISIESGDKYLSAKYFTYT